MSTAKIDDPLYYIPASVISAVTFMVVENIVLIQRPAKIQSVITISYNYINIRESTMRVLTIIRKGLL